MIKIHPIRKSIHPSINQSLNLENLLQLMLQVGVSSKGWGGGRDGPGGHFYLEDGEK